MILLLAVWFGATQHCGLEAAGFFAGHHDGKTGACCGTVPEACAVDSCETAEGDFFNPNRSDAKSMAPVLAVADAFVFLCSLAPPEAVRDPVWLPDVDNDDARAHTWHFVQRAAPSPRAPALSLA